MERRDFLRQVGAIGAAAGLAGCILTGDQTFSSSPARIPTDAAKESGYSENGVERVEREAKIELQGQQRTITVRGWISSYRKANVGENRVGEVIIVSTPNPTVAGQSLNPLLKGDTEDLLRRYAKQNANIRIQEELGEREKKVLGEDRTFDGFELEAMQNGTEVVIEAQVARFPHEEDAILVFALYPSDTAVVERAAVFDMLTDLTHPAEKPTSEQQ